MKKIMEKMQEYLANKKENSDNKGFSLVELIIVIAIMAILVGIVGTQVLPYINRSREAKDFQIINSYSTAAMTTYSSNAGNKDMPTGTATFTLSVFDKTCTGIDSTLGKELIDQIITLTGYAETTPAGGSVSDGGKAKLQAAMGSDKGKSIDKIEITVNLNDKEMKTQAYDSTGKKIFDEVVSKM